jgi:hypothetical protein
MLLEDKQFTSYLNTQIDMFLEINVDNAVCPIVVWEALKAYMRYCVLFYSSHKKNKTHEELEIIEQKIHDLERKHSSDRNVDTLQQLNTLKLEYNTINTCSAEISAMKSMLQYVEQGE